MGSYKSQPIKKIFLVIFLFSIISNFFSFIYLFFVKEILLAFGIKTFTITANFLSSWIQWLEVLAQDLGRPIFETC